MRDVQMCNTSEIRPRYRPDIFRILGRWPRRVFAGQCPPPQSTCPGATATVTRVAYPYYHRIHPCTRGMTIDTCHGQLWSLCPSRGFRPVNSKSQCRALLASIRLASRVSVAKGVQPFWPSPCSRYSSRCLHWRSVLVAENRNGPPRPSALPQLWYLDERSCRRYGSGRSKVGTTLAARKVRINLYFSATLLDR